MICYSIKDIPKKSGIYIWIFPNGKKYLGKSNNLKNRYRNHKKPSYLKTNTNKMLVRAFLKYGFENVEFRIIELTGSLNNEEILYRESIWIKFYRSLITENGYNICAYSKDCSGVPKSTHHKEKLRLANLGKKLSPETKQKISIGQKGNQHGLGHKHSMETRKKMSLSHKGKIGPRKGMKTLEKTLIKLRAAMLKRGEQTHCNKPVHQINPMTNKIIQTWKSASFAARSLGLHKANISKSCQNKIKNVGGYKWELA